MKENWFPSITQEDEQYDVNVEHQDRMVNSTNNIGLEDIELAAKQNRLVQLLKKVTPIENVTVESTPVEVSAEANVFEKSYEAVDKEHISSTVPIGTIVQNSVAPPNKEYPSVQMASAQSLRLTSSRIKNQDLNHVQMRMYNAAVKGGFYAALAIWVVGLSIYVIRLWR